MAAVLADGRGTESLVMAFTGCVDGIGRALTMGPVGALGSSGVPSSISKGASSSWIGLGGSPCSKAVLAFCIDDPADELDTRTGLVALARGEAVSSAAVTPVSYVGGARFSLVLAVSHVKAVSTTAVVVGFLVVIVAGLSVTEFSSHVEATLSTTGLSVAVVAGFSATGVIGAGFGAESSAAGSVSLL
jgi:hypothetical protein